MSVSVRPLVSWSTKGTRSSRKSVACTRIETVAQIALNNRCTARARARAAAAATQPHRPLQYRTFQPLTTPYDLHLSLDGGHATAYTWILNFNISKKLPSWTTK